MGESRRDRVRFARRVSETVEGSFSLQYLWAKTAAGGDSTWHPLILHLIDVAASCDAILALEPESTRARLGLIFGLPWDEARPWLLLLAAAHDLGKACPGFQLKWPPVLAKTGLSLPQGADTNVHHGFVSQIALSTVLIEEHGWPVELADLAADAVGCHHGERASERAKDIAMLAIECGNPTTRAGWKRARSAIITALCDVFRTGSPPTKPTLSGPDFMLLAGLVSFSDWIGSNETYFAFGTGSDCDDLRDWFTTRRDLAGKALSSIGWLPRTPLSHSENAFEDVFRRPPRPLQRAMAEVLQTIDEPAVILVEAPMGEGKTEAAFFAHLELQRRFTHRGMYLALPSKATGNAMFKRTREFLESRGCGRELDLQLLHGAKLLNDEFQRIRFSQISDPRPGGEVRAAEWFTSKKRSLLSEYGVGTLDQAITPILPVRHNFVRLWGLANRVVVLDEIHAYDTYTGTLLLHLVSWLQALGSSVVLLSATLSPSARRSLAKATGSVMPAEEVPYPRLSVFGRGAPVEQHHFEADASRRLTIELRHIGIDVANIRASIDESMPAKGMGLALVNTVQRAQDLYREFPDGSPVFTDENRVGKQLSDGTQVLLFHGRFPAEERQQREDLALASFGPTANRAGRRILIATQVAEQSLDLDFDVIVSDLAPIDLVLQRAGRLWRHDVPNRPVACPVLYVSGLDAQVPPTFGRPLWWGKVYREDGMNRAIDICARAGRPVPRARGDEPACAKAVEIVIDRSPRTRRDPGLLALKAQFCTVSLPAPCVAIIEVPDRLASGGSLARSLSNSLGLTMLDRILPLCSGGNTMANPMRTVSFKLSERLDDALSDMARHRKSSRSAIVREALETMATGKRRSVTAVVDELVGSVDGPVNLSTNPKHMAGYGK